MRPFAWLSFAVFALPFLMAACSSDTDSVSESTLDAGGTDSEASTADAAFANDASDPADAEIQDSGSDGAPSIANPSVRFIGRYDDRDPAGPIFSWPGSRVYTRFRGTEVSVKLNETSGITKETDDYDVLLDGVANATPLHTLAGTHDYTIATGVAPGEHSIEIHKRTEAYVGKTQFLGFTIVGGERLDPPTDPIRRIEFIGDSQIDGFGVEGAGPVCAGGVPSSTHNARKGFVGLVASDFGAYHAAVTISGKGLVRNEDRTDKVLFPALYPLANPYDPTSTWTSSLFPADLVVVVLGGADYSTDFSAPDAPPNDADFQSAYGAFIAQVRASQPTAYILLTIGAQIRDYNPPGYTYNARSRLMPILESVRMTRTSAGDSKIDVVVFPPAPDDASQETGCAYHGNPAFHRAMADYINPIIKKKLGW